MPLPHFLLLVIAVIALAAATLWLALAAGVPLAALGMGALIAAAAAHLGARMGDGPHRWTRS